MMDFLGDLFDGWGRQQAGSGRQPDRQPQPEATPEAQLTEYVGHLLQQYNVTPLDTSKLDIEAMRVQAERMDLSDREIAYRLELSDILERSAKAPLAVDLMIPVDAKTGTQILEAAVRFISEHFDPQKIRSTYIGQPETVVDDRGTTYYHLAVGLFKFLR